MTKLEEKMYYTISGSLLSLANIMLIDTRFNLVGLGLGLAAMYMFIRALCIKQ